MNSSAFASTFYFLPTQLPTQKNKKSLQPNARGHGKLDTTDIHWKTKHEPITKAICNKGFSGNSSILPRLNFGVNRQESSPQSLNAYSLNRYVALFE